VMMRIMQEKKITPKPIMAIKFATRLK